MYYPYQLQHAPIIVPQERNQSPEDLKASIIQLIAEFERDPKSSRAITTLSHQFNIKRRRLYDVINVFTSIGCCQKACLDHVVWLGKDKIPMELRAQAEKRDIYNPELTLSQLFQVDTCIGISNLTICFLLLFLAQKTDKLDIRFAGQFLSRDTGRYKTTLCKLYQISYILNALGVTSRSQQVCEVILNPLYQIEPPIKDDDNNEEPVISFTSINSLLNHQYKKTEDEIYLRRRNEIKECFIANVASRDALDVPNTKMKFI